jgi:hypothetical protein
MTTIVQMNPRELASMIVAALFTGIGIGVGGSLLLWPKLTNYDGSRQLESAEAKGFMLGLACGDKKKREWVLDGKSPCQ